MLAQMLVCCKKILEYWLHTSCMHAWVVAGAHKYGGGETPQYWGENTDGQVGCAVFCIDLLTM